MNIVDSSGWLEYFTDGPYADNFSEALIDVDSLIVPTISLYEVFKVTLRERGEDDAIQAIAMMQQGHFVDLTADIAFFSAKLSLNPPEVDFVPPTSKPPHRGVWGAVVV